MIKVMVKVMKVITTHTLFMFYSTKRIFRIRSCASSNIGGAWGSEHKILEMDGKSCTVQEFKKLHSREWRSKFEAKGSPIVYDLKTEWEVS